MGYTIKEATELEGTPSDRQIRRDIKSGKLRATKNSDGHNIIEGADLAITYGLTIDHDSDYGIAKKHDMSDNDIGQNDKLSYHVIDKNHPQIKALETEIKFEREQKEFYKERYDKVEDKLNNAESELTRSREMIQGLLPSPEKIPPLPTPPTLSRDYLRTGLTALGGGIAVIAILAGAYAWQQRQTLETALTEVSAARQATMPLMTRPSVAIQPVSEPTPTIPSTSIEEIAHPPYTSIPHTPIEGPRSTILPKEVVEDIPTAKTP